MQDAIIAAQVWEIQMAAYRYEAAFIDYPALPPLRQSVADLQASAEQFIGYVVETSIWGALSYEIADKSLDITRLIVNPAYFRRGIARQLLAYVEQIPAIERLTVSTAQKNSPAVTLYERYGYAVYQEQRLPDGLVLLYLEKILPHTS